MEINVYKPFVHKVNQISLNKQVNQISLLSQSILAVKCRYESNTCTLSFIVFSESYEVFETYDKDIFKSFFTI